MEQTQQAPPPLESALAALVENGDLDRIVALARVVGGAEDAMNDEMVGRVAGLASDGLDLLDRVNRSGVGRALPAFAKLVENGDLDRIVALARVVGGAQDAMNDEMVGRLAGMATSGLELLDRVNSSGIGKALPAIAKLVENGDLDRVVALARVVGGAQDAMNDEMVGRLAGLATGGLELLDRVNSSHVGRALPAISALVENGDLDRIVALARVVGSAQDALNDEMVTRLAGLATDGLELLDRVNRSGVGRALPAITALVDNGDLDRIVALARMVGSAQDALNDEMVTRLAGLAADAVSILDRVTRNGFIDRWLALADRAEKSGLVPDFMTAVDVAVKDMETTPRPQGGIGGLWTLMRQQSTQQAYQFAITLMNALFKAREKSTK
ncbi:MAG: hypothetical protein ABSC25_06365 [Roseiarcus sp.]|jgi:hypothetical protein